MNLTKQMIIIASILLSIYNVYGYKVISIKNDYKTPDMPEWVEKINEGMNLEEVLEIFNNYNVYYVAIEATLTDRIKKAKEQGIKSLCVDLAPGKNAKYPSQYMFALELKKYSSGDYVIPVSPYIHTEIEKVKIPVDYQVEDMRIVGVVTILCAMIAFDSFYRAGRLKTMIDDIDTSGHASHSTHTNFLELKAYFEDEHRRAVTIGCLSAGVSLAGIAVTVHIHHNIKISANQKKVEFTYNF